MLFKQRFLDGIARGEITLAFRRWNKPTVKAGGALRTAVGVLAIDAVTPVAAGAITAAQARAAGFEGAAELKKDIESQRTARLYQIKFRLAGADPRIALRENAALSPADLDQLRTKLARLDRPRPWTLATLRLIAKKPECRAADLALALGRKTDALKLDIRKLKNLGLTESLETGYRISPRGNALLRALG